MVMVETKHSGSCRHDACGSRRHGNCSDRHDRIVARRVVVMMIRVLVMIVSR
jgi:hypothetical protein